MSYYCICSVALPHSAVGWSAVWLWYILIILTDCVGLQCNASIYRVAYFRFSIIRIYHKYESRIEKSVRGSQIGITGLAEWWQSVIARDEFFYPVITRIMDSFSSSTNLLLEKNLKKTSRKFWIRWDATWWRNFNITVTSWIDVRRACDCSIFIFP